MSWIPELRKIPPGSGEFPDFGGRGSGAERERLPRVLELPDQRFQREAGPCLLLEVKVGYVAVPPWKFRMSSA